MENREVDITKNSGIEEKEDTPQKEINNTNIDDTNSLFQQEILTRYRQDTKHRKWLAWWMVGVVSIWLVLVTFLVYCAFFSAKGLDKSVFNMFLGTTTVNVLGLAYIVLKGLFERRH